MDYTYTARTRTVGSNFHQHLENSYFVDGIGGARTKSIRALHIPAYLIYERNVISRAVDAANGCHAGHPRFLEISWTLSIHEGRLSSPLTRSPVRAVEPPTRQLSRKCSLISIFPRALSINIGWPTINFHSIFSRFGVAPPPLKKIPSTSGRNDTIIILPTPFPSTPNFRIYPSSVISSGVLYRAKM